VRPRLLDLFCGAGGAAMGYHRAGFDVVGVDIAAQHYPFEFHRADALEYLAQHGREFDAVHASPPCQAYSTLRTMPTSNTRVDLVAATRQALQDNGRPWVIENVPGAPLHNPVVLCGSMFGLQVDTSAGPKMLRRHRLFETSGWDLWPPYACDHHGPVAGVYGTGGGGAMTRGYKVTRDLAGELLGIDWMDQAGLAQAIPPAYTEHIGARLLAHIREAAA
jgi:DNA (cytosine-5)-methyltransferase 1